MILILNALNRGSKNSNRTEKDIFFLEGGTEVFFAPRQQFINGSPHNLPVQKSYSTRTQITDLFRPIIAQNIHRIIRQPIAASNTEKLIGSRLKRGLEGSGSRRSLIWIPATGN
jgi:hypothetical protein